MIKIALTCSTEKQDYYIRMRYPKVLCQCATAAGIPDMMPVVLPITEDENLIRMYAEEFDGFIFTGGDDVDPVSYGEEKLPFCGEVEPGRDAFELALLREVIARKKPIFGICRGIQILNTYLGGTLWQDIHAQYRDQFAGGAFHFTKDDAGCTHHQIHLEGSLQELLGEESILANSYHHQSVNRLGEGLVVTARSHDGLVEAVEYTDIPYCRAVQWHPEVTPDGYSQKIFADFLFAVQNSLK